MMKPRTMRYIDAAEKMGFEIFIAPNHPKLGKTYLITKVGNGKHKQYSVAWYEPDVYRDVSESDLKTLSEYSRLLDEKIKQGDADA